MVIPGLSLHNSIVSYSQNHSQYSTCQTQPNIQLSLLWYQNILINNNWFGFIILLFNDAAVTIWTRYATFASRHLPDKAQEIFDNALRYFELFIWLREIYYKHIPVFCICYNVNISHVGLHFVEGDKLWSAYLQYEKEKISGLEKKKSSSSTM